ncbi:MAG TPA: nuclear transport factor 2 family protein [Pseudonocardiaceae bacterium]|jgi:hypothetical protein|nr:nuclear transport factor 2 family protein [Pseudonocardiaceae bacterium]
MPRLNELVDRYMAMWNEGDDDARRKTIDELYTDDAVYTFFNADPFVGKAAIFKHVTVAHRIYIPRGFTFRSCHNATGHHNLVRFNWVMLAEATGEVDMMGNDVLVLDEAGRISLDHQFHDKMASVAYEELLPHLDDMFGDVLTEGEIARYRVAFGRIGKAMPARDGR